METQPTPITDREVLDSLHVYFYKKIEELEKQAAHDALRGLTATKAEERASYEANACRIINIRKGWEEAYEMIQTARQFNPVISAIALVRKYGPVPSFGPWDNNEARARFNAAGEK